jgi:hypothetical protein
LQGTSFADRSGGARYIRTSLVRGDRPSSPASFEHQAANPFPFNLLLEKPLNLRSLAAVVAVALSGCAITQDVKPFGLDQGAHDLCLVRNSEVVQDGFHDVYVRVLEKKGFKVRSLPDKAAVTSCPLVGTYEAIYRWDMAIYLARADLRIFADGKEVGRAVYDSLSGGANMAKFIRTEPKLTELVEQLFPKLRAYLRMNLRPQAAV